jgi:4-amino-4-deoxy-L-arabinose transferase-like glycosyltransferase
MIDRTASSENFRSHPPMVLRQAAIQNWYLPVLILMAVPLIFLLLGQGSLRDWDEVVYTQVFKDMVQSGNWIMLRHGYEPNLEKPPLLIWAPLYFWGRLA